MSEVSKPVQVIRWMAQIVAAAILFQTLFFKFSGAPEPVYIFTKLGAEPWGRIGSGVIELIASIMLLIPASAAAGGLLAAVVMVGAIGEHLTKLGIVVMDDGGALFAMAWIVLICALTASLLRRDRWPWTVLRK